MPSARLARDAAAFYAAQSAFSDPNGLGRLYADLPDDPAQLARVARDLKVHRLEGELFCHVISQDRLHNDAETRYLDGILRIIIERNDAPLTQRREVGDRFVGVCRDFALLYCSFLRHQRVGGRPCPNTTGGRRTGSRSPTRRRAARPRHPKSTSASLPGGSNASMDALPASTAI
ncbi:MULTISPECIES: hypothetical protein [Streptomyces]|uniref:Uncharacterized protein n=1 Tax=Streptomyces lienomycini TaxID=284035 RepID=A0ABV9X5T2_9ACTN